MNIKNILLISFFTFISNITYSQELDVKVSISAPNLTINDAKILEQLKASVSEFFNNTKWTEDDFEKEELIKANLSIVIIDDPKTNEFIANFTLQSERPVYNSTYSTILVNISNKKINFSYLPQQTIENGTNSYFDHLSSLLTFYAYTIIGFDYDSFSQFGGDPYFNKTQDILNIIPNTISKTKTWDIDGKNSLGVMVKNILNSRFRPYRQAFYEYHRIGLDNMHDDVEKSKAILVSTLNTIKDVNKSEPNSTALQMFADAKRTELVEIFKQSSKGQQKKVYNIMVKIDPAQAISYADLR